MLVRSIVVISDAQSFRNRAQECRNVADRAHDRRAQEELRMLARDLDEEAVKIDGEEAARRARDESPQARQGTRR